MLPYAAEIYAMCWDPYSEGPERPFREAGWSPLRSGGRIRALSPKYSLGISSNIRRHIAGLAARFLPPGHSSAVNSIGQFSMPIGTLGPSRKKRDPINVFTMDMLNFLAARMTFRRWSAATLASPAMGESKFG